MTTLLLVRHANVEVLPGVPSREWRLSGEGRRRAALLAERIGPYVPGWLVSSEEAKARETADIVGARLGLGVEVVAGLHEHERRSVPHLGAETFAGAIARFFAAPQERVFGDESADEARERFAAAVRGVMDSHAAGAPEAILIITHGTVLSLYVAAMTGVDAYSFWRALDLPAMVALAPSGEAARPFVVREVWSPAH